MKKRILSLAMVLALLLAMVLPTAALAGTEVTGDVPVAPTVTSCNVTSAAHSDGTEGAISVAITGDNFIQDSTSADAVSVNGTGVAVSNITVVNTTTITATFTIAYNAPQGLRKVSVTVAGRAGTGDIFTVSYYITVAAPSTASLGLMTVGVAKEASSSTNGTVESNYNTWTVTAKDANVDAGTKGHMLKSTDKLFNPLKIGSTTGPTADADTGFNYDAVATVLPFYAKQTVDANDVAGSYTITITFTSEQS